VRAPSVARSSPEARDVATRKRLLVAATELFAARGFEHVGVREICREAGANVASVNYHFGGKARLISAVIDAALETVRGFSDHATNAGPGATPEAKLLHYVRAHLVRSPKSAAARRGAVLRELLRRELVAPTQPGRHIVEQALRPRLDYLRDVVGALLGPGAPPALVAECVMSIQAQCLLPVSMPVVLGLPPRRTRADLERLARHVVEFSLGGVRARLPRVGRAKLEA
jgi:AcrR family transcriptional regulator